MSDELTRKGARNLTEVLDKVASTLQSSHESLGVPEKIALDFAYRCDLISDAVEKKAVEATKLAEKAVEELGAETTGPIFEEDADPDIKGQFTQKEFSELTEMAEKLEKKAQSLRHMVVETINISA
jgi:hypothetical protein